MILSSSLIATQSFSAIRIELLLYLQSSIHFPSYSLALDGLCILLAIMALKMVIFKAIGSHALYKLQHQNLKRAEI